MYLLDTNHCSRFPQKNAAVVQRVAQAGKPGVATCVIVQAELMYMAYNSERVTENLLEVRSFLGDIRVYLLDD